MIFSYHWDPCIFMKEEFMTVGGGDVGGILIYFYTSISTYMYLFVHF